MHQQATGSSLSSEKPRVIEPRIPSFATELVGNDEKARGPNPAMARNGPDGGRFHLDSDDAECDQLSSSRA